MKKILFVLTMYLIIFSVNASEPVGKYLPQKFHTFINAHIGTFADGPTGINCDGTVIGGSIVGGYQFSRIVNGGIGIAPAYVEMWTRYGGDESYEIPIFTQFTFDNMNHKINSFAKIRVGAAIYERGPAALYLNGGFGMRIKRFTIGISWTEEILCKKNIENSHIGYFSGTFGFVI